ncbi:MAG: IS256-like element ISRm5 family transposase [Ktedonobacteraceae bacterium]
MTHQDETTRWDELVQLLCNSPQEQDRFATVLRLLLNEAMKAERSQVLAAQPYERTAERQGYANGFKPRTVHTGVGPLAVQIPQVRGAVDFYPSALEKGVRSERALKLVIAQMYVQGISTRKVTRVMQEMCGLEVSSTQVSRCAALLDEELQRWRERPLGEIPYLILDARYEKVRVDGAVVSCAVLSAIGIDASGHRSVLGTSVSLSEAEIHWRSFIESLQERGLFGVRLVVSDDHAGLKAALRARLAGVPWQRCQFHLMQNALHLVPHLHQRAAVAEALRGVFNAATRPAAERLLEQLVRQYEKSLPRLAQWLETNVPEGLTVCLLPAPQRRYLRTTNMLERVHKEIKRRTRVAALFPNEASLLRLVSAVLMEISEEWECGKVYLPGAAHREEHGPPL